MNFDVYFPFVNKEGKTLPGVTPVRMDWGKIKNKLLHAPEVLTNIAAYRQGDKEAKKRIPAINFVGRSVGKRKASDMIPTQLVMVDIDHCEKPRESWFDIMETINKKMPAGWIVDNVMLSHITPSGKGLHIFFVSQQGFSTLKENMDYFNELLNFSQYGDYDAVVHDFSRISFAFLGEDLLWESAVLCLETPREWPEYLVNENFAPEERKGKSNEKAKDESLFNEDDYFTEDEKKEFEDLDYRGTLVKDIIAKYVEVYGAPGKAEIHNYYNEMVKYFRNITSNNKRALLYLLPRFGHTLDECSSQISSICRVNTLSTLPKPFYFFLKDHGFYKARTEKASDVMTYMMADGEDKKEPLPWMPPVFRELVGSAPPDFIVPSVCALLPIMGTLTSYIEAVYPFDNRVHTTSFFSIVYAPPGTGKGFVERFLDMLFEDLRLRDFIQSERENVYIRACNKKSANDKSPDRPITSLRIIPPKNSEAEFLQKTADNCGYHMFTYAAEMDSWAKGVKAAGGNKDDMIRIAWDNGRYGQQFKSLNTFKGEVNLYWNVLITGTIDQVERYFKNVENGLVTRCSFSSIDNQEFCLAPVWKSLSSAKKKVIMDFVRRCDENSYEEPCQVSKEDLLGVSDADFDKDIQWKMKFRPKQRVDMSWIMPTIVDFQKEQMALAAQDVDTARDVFRRRVGVRGFRLAMICMALWAKPTKAQLEKCKGFVWWWMHKDIEQIMKLFGAKYNELSNPLPNLKQRSVFSALGEQFTREDVYTVCMKQGIKSPIRKIIFDWNKLGYIEKLEKNLFKKKKK